ncbi:T9SS type A sorting domain-containing protein [Flavobacterium subsaxonicum]|uniref:Secretion system C-terminal sorting domain-containing protein n=1 Tax=Flavobacterium subsaxonicum WB 4.1-42 = DSM 21790 TaxID=1121898 RepID=A0A0A2MSQ3_9FLAO|nr:T9SS type A sorting domain-containing protein [Flavobacterium subsaxonicum]KGO94631.1 hypothetical protein Q766_00465 [Flavobacterium subsaxonicum WB 4.1-42 = DSM 21790]
MKKIIYLLLLLIAGITANAQTFEWLKTPQTLMPYNPDMVGYSTALDQDGNVFFSGFKSNPFIYNSIMGSMYLNKYDINGTLLFSKTISGNAQSHSMVADHDGNVILALSFVATITIEDVTLTTINQDEQWLVAKFDTNGNLLWHHQLTIDEPEGSGLNIISEAKPLAIDATGNIYTGYGNFSSTYITKLSASGTVLSTIEQSGVSRITSLSIDTEGNIYSAGGCANWNATFAGVLNAPPQELLYNIYLTKYSATGTFQWVKYVEDITCSEPHVVTRHPNEVYFCSYLFGAFNFDDITSEGSAAFEDFFLTKLNADGQYLWLREVPGSGGIALGNRNFLNLDANGNIYIAGKTSGTINWGNGITTGVAGFGSNALILKYSPGGTVVMAKTGGAGGYTRFDGLCINADSEVFAAGMGFDACSFDSITYNPQQQTDYYPYLAKLNNEVLGNASSQLKTTVLYPNPATDLVYISGTDQNVNGSIVNTLGQKLQSFTIGINTPLNVAPLPKGTYFVQLDGYIATKLIKN